MLCGDLSLGLGLHRQVGRALVKLHHDVGVQRGLDLHADLGCEKQLVAIDRRGKLHALFGDFAHVAQAPDLKTARVGKDRFVPFLKRMQAAKLLHHVQPRAHPQVKGVAQNDLCPHFMQAAWHHTLDGSVSAYRHEDGRLDHTVVQGQATATGVATQVRAIWCGGVCGKEVKFEHC